MTTGFDRKSLMKTDLLPLIWYLEHIEYFSTSKLLYLIGSYPWNSQSKGMIYYDESADEFDPEWKKSASQIGLTAVLDVGIIQDIMAVLHRQTKKSNIELAIQSFNYYYKHDSYLKI